MCRLAVQDIDYELKLPTVRICIAQNSSSLKYTTDYGHLSKHVSFSYDVATLPFEHSQEKGVENVHNAKRGTRIAQETAVQIYGMNCNAD